MLRFFWIFNLFIFSGLLFGQAPKVGLCLDAMETSRWHNDSLLFALKVEFSGGEVLSGVANYNHKTQIRQARNMVRQGCKVLVVVSSNSKKAWKIVKMAHKKGVKVIAYDRLITDAPLDYYVSFDNMQVGYLQAQFALDSVPEGNYALICGPTIDNNAFVVRDRQMNALTPHLQDSSISVVLDKHMKGWRSADAYSGLENFYQKNPDAVVDVFLASNDDLALGVYDYLIDHAKYQPEVIITGQDGSHKALKRILEGKQSMTIYKPLSLTAEAAADLAMQIASGKEVDEKAMGSIFNGNREVPFVKMKPISVDLSNAAKYYR